MLIGKQVESTTGSPETRSKHWLFPGPANADMMEIIFLPSGGKAMDHDVWWHLS